MYSMFYTQVWCTNTGKALLKSDVPQRSPCARSCALSPNGTVAAAGFDDGSLKVCTYMYSIFVVFGKTTLTCSQCSIAPC